MICYKCNEPVTKEQGYIDHILPLSQGGDNSKENIRVVHRTCHLHHEKPSLLQSIIIRIKHPSRLLCDVGRHKWLPLNGTERTEYVNKWVGYEYATGFCSRFCGVEDRELRRDAEAYSREPNAKELKVIMKARGGKR